MLKSLDETASLGSFVWCELCASCPFHRWFRAECDLDHCLDLARSSSTSHGNSWKYRTLDLETKVKILGEVEKGSTAKQDIARKYGIKPNTLYNLVKSKCSILDAFEHEHDTFRMLRKRMRRGVEKAPLVWVREARNNKLPLSGEIVAARAQSLAAMLGSLLHLMDGSHAPRITMA